MRDRLERLARSLASRTQTPSGTSARQWVDIRTRVLDRYKRIRGGPVFWLRISMAVLARAVRDNVCFQRW
jgi:hypothetical protein